MKEARNPRQSECESLYFKIKCPRGIKIKGEYNVFEKSLNQPNLVGTMLIALMVCAGFVYAFAFDGFNVEVVTGGEVEAWLGLSVGPNYGKDCNINACVQLWAGCPGNGCENCTKVTPNLCSSNCKHGHQGCRKTGNCAYNNIGNGYCSEGGLEDSNGNKVCPSSSPNKCNKK